MFQQYYRLHYSILNKLKLPKDDARALGMIHFGSLCLTLAELPLLPGFATLFTQGAYIAMNPRLLRSTERNMSLKEVRESRVLLGAT